MKRYYTSITYLLFLCFFPFGIKAQISSDIAGAIYDQVNLISQEFGQDSQKMDFLLQGINYLPSEPLTKGSPFYPQDAWIRGTLITPNHYFSFVNLRYDAYDDRLLYLDPSLNSPAVVLNPELIDGFVVQEKKFVYLEDDNTNGLGGFFEEVYHGKTSVFQKIRAKIRKSGEDPFGQFYLTKSYYLQSGDKFLALKNKKDLFDAFPNQKEQIKDYLKANQIRFGKISPEQFVKLFTYLDQA